MLNNYRLSKMVCSILPPIASQWFRHKLISIAEGERMHLDFVKKSFTGSRFFGNTSDFHAFKFSIHGYFDWRNVILANSALQLKRGDIVEVGANIGTETISFADLTAKFKTATHAFEPVSSNLKYLQVIKDENKLEQLHLYQQLVSDKKGRVGFVVPTQNDSGSGYISETGATNENQLIQEFDVITIDETFANTPISFLSIDVEGFEYQVLNGASQTLTNQRPYVVIEVNLNYLKARGKVTLTELDAFLNQHDYAYFYITKLGLEVVDIHHFKTYPNKNWLCIPKERIDDKKYFAKSILLNAFNPFLFQKII